MVEKIFKPFALVVRSYGWPFLKQANIYRCDIFGKEELAREIPLGPQGGKPEDVVSFFQDSQMSGIRNVVIDLGEVLEIHSTLLGFYVYLQKEVENLGGEVVVANPSQRVLTVIKLTRLDKYFSVANSVGEAIETFSEHGGNVST